MKLFLFIFFIVFLGNPNSLYPQSILGQWKLIEVRVSNQNEILAKLKPDQSEKYNQQLEDLQNTAVFIFTEEKKAGKQYYVNIDGNIEKGAWEIDKDNNILLMVGKEGTSERFKLDKWDDLNLELSQEREKKKIVFVFIKK